MATELLRCGGARSARASEELCFQLRPRKGQGVLISGKQRERALIQTAGFKPGVFKQRESLERCVVSVRELKSRVQCCGDAERAQVLARGWRREPAWGPLGKEGVRGLGRPGGTLWGLLRLAAELQERGSVSRRGARLCGCAVLDE